MAIDKGRELLRPRVVRGVKPFVGKESAAGDCSRLSHAGDEAGGEEVAEDGWGWGRG